MKYRTTKGLSKNNPVFSVIVACVVGKVERYPLPRPDPILPDSTRLDPISRRVDGNLRGNRNLGTFLVVLGTYLVSVVVQTKSVRENS